ncbi:TonB family protein [Shewanella maritima]|uniref:energy transducer TonB n=1 Tax=Shewanella maritima TaxID=2520507 RepID=UPI003735B00B
MNQQNLLSQSTIVFTGACITFALFVFMSQLIKTDHVYQNAPDHLGDLQLFFKPPKEAEVIKKDRIKPKPDVPQVARVAPPTATESEESFSPIDIIPPEIPTTNEWVDSSRNNAEALPVVQISPQYPMDAARDGKEGYVVVMFDIAASGEVINAQVVEAQPKRIFNRAAIQAINNWKYKPKMVEGKVINQTGVQVRLDFQLDKAN